MNVLERTTSPRITSLVSILAFLLFLPILLFGAYQSVVLISRAVGTPAAIVVDTKALLEPIKTDFSHAFAQGGEEMTDMIAPVIPEVKALRPKLIRIDHIYDYYQVVSGSGGGMTFDFSRLDAAIDSILATGAKPVIVLSYMPPSIARGGSVIEPPNDWNDWAMVVQRTIEHYSGKGERNLGGIFYEVWNEPDLAHFGSWKLSGDKNYLTLYSYAQEGAKRAQNTQWFYLGGPATTGLYKNWIMALAGSGKRVDFFSWHTYAADPKKYTEDQANFITWMLPYPWHTLKPTLITEFGFTGDKSSLYGTTYAAAHTAAVVRQLISGGPTYLFSFELKDGPQQSDGWGLITHQDAGKKPKPRYYVYGFLDRMVGTRLQVTGEGTWVTGFASLKEGVIRIFLVNFDPRGSHTETVPVTLTNLDPGTYTVREQFFLGRDTTSEKTIDTGTYQHALYMPAQSIAILEFTKK